MIDGRDGGANFVGAVFAPTPFSADEIRDGCPRGREVTVRVETADEDPYLRRICFVAVDAIGATQTLSQFTLDGDPIGETKTVYATWKDLQAHASFPRDRTTIDRETIETPMGSLECLRYTVDEDGRLRVFWFAVAIPGMPVRFTVTEDGTVTDTSTMVANTAP
ncbi:MAG: hypothetical protein R2823_04895 [Acidimicrobiia bacterium]